MEKIAKVFKQVMDNNPEINQHEKSITATINNREVTVKLVNDFNHNGPDVIAHVFVDGYSVYATSYWFFNTEEKALCIDLFNNQLKVAAFDNRENTNSEKKQWFNANF